MASAKKTTVKVTKVVDEQAVSLELSNDEAQLLTDILGFGVVGKGRRYTSSGIYAALESAGFDAHMNDFQGLLNFRG